MIIATYAGVGKSFFANHVENAIDLVSIPNRWILPKTDENKEFKDIKAAPFLLSNPLFPYNYLSRILESEKQYDYVLILSIGHILEGLSSDYATPYILCYPDKKHKEEYMKRYIKRGNNETFLDVFIGQWDTRIKLLEDDEFGFHVKLGAGEFLFDAKDCIDLIKMELNKKQIDESLTSYEELLIQIEELSKDTCLCFEDNEQRYIYPFDINNPMDKKFIYCIGKTLYQKGIYARTHLPIWIYEKRQDEFGCRATIMLHCKGELLNVINKIGK